MRSTFLKSFRTIALLLICSSVTVLSQDKEKTGSVKQANEKFLAGNYEEALEEYELLVKTFDDDKYNYRLAVCYLNTNIDKKKAIPLLEEVVSKEKYEVNALYLLGRAYHYANRFEDAIKMFNKYKQSAGVAEENMKNVDKQIEYCYNAREIIKFPVNVSFENVKAVNSPYPDYYPFVPQDESFLLFNSRRDEGAIKGVDGKFTADVFISFEKGGKWQKAKSIGEAVNTDDGDEEISGMDQDGKTLIYSFDNNKGSGDLFIGTKAVNTFSPPKMLSSHINSKANEIAATLSPDGQIIYFASDRPGGHGGTDLYRCQRLPSGDWSEPFNLGPMVNTAYDEDFPTLSPDGKTLYFSSKGHTSMGGYDIFHATWDSLSLGWAGVKNIGYPVNTPDDNMNLCISDNGRYGYISALRDGGEGDLDIYRIMFNDVEPRYTVIKGLISSNDAYKKPGTVNISIYTDTSGDLYGSYVPNPSTGRYVIILPPGKYKMEIEADGFRTLSENLTIADKASFQTTIDKDIRLLSN